ncbi:outer membrane beta-barrel family protein [Marinifilum caeruleilacunae]|uniref:TonB-dependent receptor n=1 Tax=Marinifilum caeruleilacunae TaxID=2499076 RepID=A0ABX1WWQ6_9BACT|nr:outer membrane beta-barrel family protein [Marinifilum caeruleilacunae]NOU60334.1 TonB-dependent receptor [Marinifilum caeruleilacunae]
MNKKLLSLFGLLITLSCFQAFAETNIRKIVVSGKIIEKSSEVPIEYATIAILANDGQLITGGISGKDGSFQLESPRKDFYIKVSFIGYQTIEIKDFNIKNNKLELHAIYLSSSHAQLGDVIVRAEKSQTVFKLDKRVFNVGQDLVSAGGSALDILNNVPSVDVSIEGTISLRGSSSVQMLINGKPSVMASSKTLGTITADMIDRVEVVTNPSAKYDAEGTSGIINIILKKDNKKGLNGAVTANVGSPKNYSFGLGMNRRTEKLNLFTQIGIGDRRFLSENYSKTINYLSDTQPQTISKGDGEKNEQFYNFILGADYHISKYQSISVSGHYAYESEDEYSTTNYEYNELLGSGTDESIRKETTSASNPKWQYELNYTKEFADNKERKLSASATGSFFGKDKISLFTNTEGNGYLNLKDEKIDNDFSNAEYSFQADYVHPFSEHTILESGVKMDINLNKDEQIQYDQSGEDWLVNDNLSNKFEFDQNISALYSTYAYEGEKISFKLGLRAEHEYKKSKLENTQENNSSNDTRLFPIFHTSYKMNEGFSLQAGYSKRIRRPHMWDLNPFESFRDPLNISKGNPDLKPSLSDAFEITAIRQFKSGSINASVFYTHTKDVVDDIYFVNDNVRTTMPVNVGKSKNTGVEINSKLEPLQWLSLLAEANFTAYKRTGSYEEQDFDFSNESWSARMTAKFKLPYQIDAEYKFRYRSKAESLQGFYKAISYSDFGIRKKFMKGKAVINLSVKDVFDSRKRKFESKSSDFYTYSEHRRSGRLWVVGISFGFGKGETMEYSGVKMF